MSRSNIGGRVASMIGYRHFATELADRKVAVIAANGGSRISTRQDKLPASLKPPPTQRAKSRCFRTPSESPGSPRLGHAVNLYIRTSLQRRYPVEPAAPAAWLLVADFGPKQKP